MSIDEQASDPLLDRAISEVRNESVDPAAVSAALDAEKDRLRWFTDTSWNVKAAQE